MKKSIRLATVISSLALVFGVGVSLKTSSTEVKAGYTEVTKCDFTTKASKHTTYLDNWTYDTDWNVCYGANNNGGWAFVKFGAAAAGLASANPCYFNNIKEIKEAVSKVSVDIAAGSLPKSGMSVNSWGLYVYSDAALTTQIDYVAGGTIGKTAATFNFTPTTGTAWAAKSYFKVLFDLANTSTTNGIVWCSGATFYSGGASAVSGVTINGAASSSATKDGVNEYDTLALTGAVVYSGETGTNELTWSSSVETVATVDTKGVVSYIGNGTTVITATSVEDKTKSATYTLTISNIVAEHGSVITDPLTVAEAIAYAQAGKTVREYFVSGVIKSISDFDETNKYYTVHVGANIADTNDFQYFRMVNNGEDFDGSEGFEVGGTMVAHGVLFIYNKTVYEFSAGCKMYSYTAPVTVQATDIEFDPTSINVDAGKDFEFTPTLVGGSGAFENTISWTSSHPTLIAAPADSEGGVKVTGTAGGPTVETVVTLTGTVVSPGSATNSIEITVAPVADSVTANKSNYNKVEGETLDLESCVTTTGASALSFTCPDAYVSIDGMTLTAVSVGVATVTAHKGSATATFTVTVTANTGYELVTDASQLVNGKKYVFASKVTVSDVDTWYAMCTTQKTKNRDGVVAELKGGRLVKTETIAAFTLLSADEGRYAFFDGSTDDLKLIANKSSSSSSLKSTGVFGDDTALCTISVAGTGIATITYGGVESRNQMWFNYNGTTKLFNFYSSTITDDNYKNVYLYACPDAATPASAADWATDFLDLTGAVCDNGVTAIEKTDWDDIKKDFTDRSIPEQFAVAYNTPDVDHAAALARYDFIVNKYTSFDDFLNRRSASSVNNVFGILGEDNSIIAIVSIISIASLAGFGFILVSKKRKSHKA